MKTEAVNGNVITITVSAYAVMKVTTCFSFVCSLQIIDTHNKETTCGSLWLGLDYWVQLWQFKNSLHTETPAGLSHLKDISEYSLSYLSFDTD